MNKTVMKWFQYGFILLLGLVMIYPVLWMIAGSFKTDQEILSGSLNLIPETFRWENYAEGWAGFAGISFFTFFKNSFVISAVSTIGTVLSSTCIAYALSRIDFKGKKVLVRRHVSNDDDSCTSDFDSAVYYLQSAKFGWYVCAADFTALFWTSIFYLSDHAIHGRHP